MKYPQLVSTRAVNAISDWLVSRLEQLGVEAPLIYSRLLLSLLQSSVQINDPIEFSNLETFLANRKGNNKRYPPCDTDTLRKITAVQCLMEIVSSEQEITNIENLVDELCEKLIDIEKQSTSLEEDDDHLQIATSTTLGTATPSLSSSSSLNKKNDKLISAAGDSTITVEINDSKITEAVNRKAANQQQQQQQITSDVEDPRKRYYRAFPALSKEMEDSIGLLRRNTKSLTWPVDRKINLSVVKNSNTNSSTNNITKLPISATAAATEKVKITICVDDDEKNGVGVSGPSTAASLDSSQGGDSNTVLCYTAGVKRKSKRRRNQASSKGKTTAGNNLRKNSYCGGGGGGGGSSSPTWDTDFEGSWEMGRDLIKEFIVKQNNRNRSTSESAAYNMAIGGANNLNGSSSNDIKSSSSIINDKTDLSTINNNSNMAAQQIDAAAAIAININKNNQELAEVLADPCVVEVSLCENIVENNSKSDDMMSDNNNTMTEGSLSTARRLYERDISNDSLNEQNLLISQQCKAAVSSSSSIHHHHHGQEELFSSSASSSSSASATDQLDFAQFKAKFNSSVEALWKTESATNNNTNNNNNDNHSLLQSSSLNIVNDTTISVAPPRSEDLKNFWTNYYSHRYDVDKFKESLDYPIANVVQKNEAAGSVNTNLFSMPIISGGGGNGGHDEFDKSVGGKRAVKTSPIGVFLQSTIWSENSNASYPDTDESFFMKVLNSTSKNKKPQDQLKMDISSGTDKSSYFYPYQASKWSEGINGGPNVSTTTAQQHHFTAPQQQQQQHQPLVVTSSSASSSISIMDQSSAAVSRNCFNNDFVDSTTSSSSSYIGGNPNWHLPAGSNFQADIKSWSSSNPTSLTELYGGNGGIAVSSSSSSSLGKKNSYNFDRNPTAAAAALVSSSSSTSSPTTSSTKITLANHSATTSGFLAYSRIKSFAKLIDAKPIVKWQKPELDYHHHPHKQHLAPTPPPPDDENLLTSERTHFHPIKMSYADGHTFEICSNLDAVDFERSESGYLYLESERYLEYTRSDALAEEDSSVAGHYNQPQQQSLLLTPNRDCSSSVASTKSSQSSDTFLIRFRVRNTDQACQTDSSVIGSNGYRNSTLSYQASASHLILPTSHITSHECNTTNNTGGNCDDDDNNDDDDEWMDIGCIGGGGVGAGNTKDDEECVSMEQWSMVEITKKCMDNNNASHTLWGMCPACSSDIKSNPANRLLKAELNVEGDEIMSDLRYMQDLYIGNDWDDEDQNCTREDDNEDVENDADDDDDDTDLDAETIRDCEYYQTMETPAGCGGDNNNMMIEEEDHQQKEILYNVNKLIADLLRPENAHSLANALGAVGVGAAGGVGGRFRFGGGDVAVADGKTDEKYIGGLWNSDENIIWKKEFKPFDIFSRYNNNNNDSFLDKLNWEYSNLAEIWEKSSPERGIIPNEQEQEDQKRTTTNTTTTTAADNITSTITTTTADNCQTEVDDDEEENIKIACRNMKNILKSSTNPIMLSNENAALFEINAERRLNDSKRMQCFLSSNKFKITNRFDRKRRHSASQNVCTTSSSSCSSSSTTANNNNNNPNYSNNNNNSIIYDNNNSKFSFASSSSDTNSNSSTNATQPNNTITTTTTTNLTKATTKDTLTDYDRNIIIPRNDNDDNDQHYFSHDDEQDEQERENNNNNNNNNNNDDDDPLTSQQQRQATIITCKYWTTMQPIVNNNNNNNSNGNNGGKVGDDDDDGARDAFFIDKNSQFIDGLPSITLNTSSILKHVTLVSRPLTR